VTATGAKSTVTLVSMSAVAKELDLDAGGREDVRFQVLRRLHETYVAFDILKAALGLAALGLWA
jgi:hypothetical protein